MPQDRRLRRAEIATCEATVAVRISLQQRMRRQQTRTVLRAKTGERGGGGMKALGFDPIGPHHLMLCQQHVDIGHFAQRHIAGHAAPVNQVFGRDQHLITVEQITGLRALQHDPVIR